MGLDDILSGTWNRFKSGVKDTPEIMWAGAGVLLATGYHIFTTNSLPSPTEMAVYTAAADIIADPWAEWILPMFDKGIVKASEDYFGKYAKNLWKVPVEFILEPAMMAAGVYFVSKWDDARNMYDAAKMSISDAMGYVGFKGGIAVGAGYATEAVQALAYPLTVGAKWVGKGIVYALDHWIEPALKHHSGAKFGG